MAKESSREAGGSKVKCWNCNDHGIVWVGICRDDGSLTAKPKTCDVCEKGKTITEEELEPLFSL